MKKKIEDENLESVSGGSTNTQVQSEANDARENRQFVEVPKSGSTRD